MKPTIRRRNFPYHLTAIRDADVKLHKESANYMLTYPVSDNLKVAKDRYVRWLQHMRAANTEILHAAQRLEAEIKQELSVVWFNDAET